ncbi:MAG: hypothetical protein RR782_02860 [Clostridium sp.]
MKILNMVGLCKASEIRWLEGEFERVKKMNELLACNNSRLHEETNKLTLAKGVLENHLDQIENELEKYKKESFADALAMDYAKSECINLEEELKEVKLEKEKYRDLYIKATDKNCYVAKKINERFQEAILDIRREFDNTIGLKLHRNGSKKLYLRSRPIALLKKISSYMGNLSEITVSIFSEIESEILVEGVECKEISKEKLVERMLSERVAINCKTLEDSKELLEMLKSEVVWLSGDVTTGWNCWEYWEKETCYYIDDEGFLVLGGKEARKSKGYEVVEW